MSEPTKSKPSATDFEAKFLDSAAFAKGRYPHGWLIRGVLVSGQPAVLGGPKKTLKTSVAVDMAVSLGSGEPFLGKFGVPGRVRVALMSGESGPATVRETAIRVCEEKGLKLKDCDVLWSSDLPRLANEEDRRGLKAYLHEHKVGVVLIDPLYLCLLAGGRNVSAGNLYEIGPLLRQAGQACLSAGATPVFTHHTTKGGGKKAGRTEPLDLDDLAFSGIGEYVRQWLLLNRRSPYQPGTGDHLLLMSVGGSAGHSGCWEVDVNEGELDGDFGGRGWQVRVRRADGPGGWGGAAKDEVSLDL
jgi:replicative DNA helicase